MVALRGAPQRRTIEPPGRPSRTTVTRAKRTIEDVRRSDGRLDYSPPRLGERIYFRCPVCGDGNADATFKTDYSGDARWFVGCKSAKCADLGGGYLRALAVKLDTTATAFQLLEDPRPFVKMLPSSGRRTVAAGKDAGLPSEAEFAGWARRLLAEPEPMRWLRDERGVSLDVIEEQGIGWDGERLTFPMFGAAGAIVAGKHRKARNGAQMRSWPGGGRAWPLYPSARVLVPDDDWRLIGAGELDALAGRSVGLPTFSGTLGAATWRDDWTAQLQGLRVVVCFDNNESLFARMVTDRLIAAGVDATRFDLRRVGLRTPTGDLSDYLRGGGSASDLRRAALGIKGAA